MIKRISICGKNEAGKLDFLALFAPNARSFDRDAATASRDLAVRCSGSSGRSVWIALSARAAEVYAVLLHHRLQDLLS